VIPEFDDDMAPTRVRDPRTDPPPQMEHPIVRMPPMIPANGPNDAAPAGAAPRATPTVAVEASPRRRRPVMAPIDPQTLAELQAAPVAVSPVVDPSRPLVEALPAVPSPPSFHWVERQTDGGSVHHTFEFTGAAAKLNDGKSIMMDSIDFEPVVSPKESVLQTGNGTWFLLTFALVFVAASIAFLLSSEITVGVNTVWHMLQAIA
jgi:hypothetical protein